MSDRLSRYDSFKGSVAGPIHSDKLPEGNGVEPLLAGDPLTNRNDVIMPLEEVQTPQAPEVELIEENVESKNEYRQERTTMIVPAVERSRRSLLFRYKKWRSMPA